MTQTNNNKKNFWQKYKYVLLFTLIVPVALVIMRALRPQKKQDNTSQTNRNAQDNTAKNNQGQGNPDQNNQDQNKTGIANNNPSATDNTPDNKDKNASDKPDDQDKNLKTEKDIPPTKGDANTLAANNAYAKFYTPRLAKKKQSPIPESVTFYYPPNGEKRPGRKLTAPSPIQTKKTVTSKKTVIPKVTYKIQVLPEPKAKILSDQTDIFANVELKSKLLDRQLTQSGDGLVKKVFKTKKGEVGEVEMELWVLARHWQRSQGRIKNRVYCTNNKGKLDLDNLQDGRFYLEPVLNEEQVLFGTLQQMPNENPIEVLETQKKKFKSYDDQYNQYTWFKVKVKGYIKWQQANTNKKEDKG